MLPFDPEMDQGLTFGKTGPCFVATVKGDRLCRNAAIAADGDFKTRQRLLDVLGQVTELVRTNVSGLTAEVPAYRDGASRVQEGGATALETRKLSMLSILLLLCP